MSVAIRLFKEMLSLAQREKGFGLWISSCLSGGVVQLPDPSLVSRFWWPVLPVRRFEFEP